MSTSVVEPPTTTKPVLSARDLRIATTSGYEILHGVSFTLQPGKILALVGESGSGKTTAGLACLGHFRRGLKHTGGEIHLAGTGDHGNILDLPEAERRKLRGGSISYVPQDPALSLNPAMTIGRQIQEVLQVHHYGNSEEERRARAKEVLAEVGLENSEAYQRRYPHQLSGGQQQRVGVARALAAEPNVLLMDEPFGALDPIIRAKAQDDLAAIQKHFGTTIILVTHDMEEAFHLADRIAVMDKGEVVQYATPAEMLVRPATPFVETLVGASERPFRLLGIETVGEAVEPGSAEGRPVPEVLSQRDALSELLWTGRSALPVAAADGAILGKITLEAIVKRAARRQ